MGRPPRRGVRSLNYQAVRRESSGKRRKRLRFTTSTGCAIQARRGRSHSSHCACRLLTAAARHSSTASPGSTGSSGIRQPRCRCFEGNPPGSPGGLSGGNRGLLLCRSLGLGGLGGGLPLFGRLRAVLLGKTFHAPLGVDQLLAAREERVAGRADFEVQLRLGRPGLERVSTRATDLDLLVLRVNAFLHNKLLHAYPPQFHRSAGRRLREKGIIADSPGPWTECVRKASYPQPARRQLLEADPLVSGILPPHQCWTRGRASTVSG